MKETDRQHRLRDRVEHQAATGKSVAALEQERDRLEEEYRLLLDLYVELAQ